MKRVCAWCNKGLGEVAPLDNPMATHGICQECLKALKADLPFSKIFLVSQQNYSMRKEIK